jgi:hypothetical protein
MCGRYDLNESPQMLALYFRLSAEPPAFRNMPVNCFQFFRSNVL